MTATLSAIGLDTLKDLVRPADAAFTTVYLAPPASTDRDMKVRWHAIASLLASEGAARADIDAVGRYLVLAGSEPAEGIIVVRDAQVVLAQVLPGAVTADIAHYGAAPMLGPFLSYWQRHPAYVLATLKPDGIAITTVRNAIDETTSFPTATDNAADELMAEIAASGTDLVLLDGGKEADELAAEVRSVDARITVHRLPAVSTPAERHAAIRQALDAYATALNARLLAAVDASASPRSTTIQGVYATLAALSLGRVATLLVFDDRRDRRQAWYGAGALCAVLPDLVQPERTRHQGRLTDVAIRAALLTDAGIRVLNADEARWLRGGIGAICR